VIVSFSIVKCRCQCAKKILDCIFLVFLASVVGGAVVVAKTLLQSQKSGVKPVIAQLAKMVDRVSIPPARAAILWLLGEYCERLPHLPPDVLRKMAKTFPEEVSFLKH